jgi:eukaryotic-like serine/threonine-protein kinase
VSLASAANLVLLAANAPLEADPVDASQPSAPRPQILSPGQSVTSSYVIESEVGQGATGVVYVAHRHPESDRVALKVIHRHLCGDKQVYSRFKREAAILRRLEGPFLVKPLDFIEHDGLLILALEYVDGIPLDKVLTERGAITLDEAVEITLQICAALGAAHAAGVVHRDLKPANVLIEKPLSDRPGLRVRVVDFGLAKVVQGELAGTGGTGLTEQGMIFGTAEYMAPEQARGEEVDRRCDIYAAGVMLYEMAVGQVPFTGRTPIAAMTAHLTSDPPSPRVTGPKRGISPTLEAVILRALSKRPGDRYPTARAMAEALAAARDEPHVIAPHPVSDAESIGTSDTDLHIADSVPEIANTLRSGKTPPVVIIPARQDDWPAGVPVRGRGSERWIWAVVVVIAAALAVIIGAVAGAR